MIFSAANTGSRGLSQRRREGSSSQRRREGTGTTTLGQLLSRAGVRSSSADHLSAAAQKLVAKQAENRIKQYHANDGQDPQGRPLPVPGRPLFSTAQIPRFLRRTMPEPQHEDGNNSWADDMMSITRRVGELHGVHHHMGLPVDGRRRSVSRDAEHVLGTNGVVEMGRPVSEVRPHSSSRRSSSASVVPPSAVPPQRERRRSSSRRTRSGQRERLADLTPGSASLIRPPRQDLFIGDLDLPLPLQNSTSETRRPANDEERNLLRKFAGMQEQVQAP